MKTDGDEEIAQSEYVKKKVASASLKKARKLLDSYEKEKKTDWDWALFAIIIFVVLVLCVVLATFVSRL